jgi:hypothetical protein
MNRIFTKIIGQLMVALLGFYALAPTLALARVDQVTMDASTTRGLWQPNIRAQRFSADNQRVTEYKESATTISEWQRADKRDPRHEYNPQLMMTGELWASMGRDDIGRSGVDPKLANEGGIMMIDVLGNTPVVIARYHPETAKLRIDVITLLKRPDYGRTFTVTTSHYTPHHGQEAVRNGEFRSDGEIAAKKPGYNPFEQFRGHDNDPVFHNINPGAAQVALAWAMSYHKAAVATWVQTTSRVEVDVRESGNFFQKTTTVTTKGFVKPSYYIAKPANMSYYWGQPFAPGMGALCVVPGLTSCDDPNHVVVSSIYLEPLDGGSVKPVEELVYTDVQSHSGFTALFFAVIIFLAVYLGPAALDAVAAAEGGAAEAVIGADVTGSAVMSEVALATLIAPSQASIGYLGLVEVFQGGSPVSMREDIMGGQPTVTNPAAVSSGLFTGVPCSNSFCANFYAAIQAKQINAPIVDLNNANSGFASTKLMVQGECPPTWKTEQCERAGKSAGVMWRVDDWKDSMTTYHMKVREVACRERGLEGLELRQCIVPPLLQPKRPQRR